MRRGPRPPGELREIRRRAEAWSAGFYEAAAGSLLAATTAAEVERRLVDIQSSFVANIGGLYGSEIPAAGEIGLAPLASKVAALDAALTSGPGGRVLAPAIAGGIVRAMAGLVIAHFEGRA